MEKKMEIEMETGGISGSKELGFWVLGLRFRVLGLVFRVSGLRF